MDKLPVRHDDGPARRALDVDGPTRRSFARLESNGRPCLEGISETEIGLYKVFHRRIEVMIPTSDPIIAGLPKDSDMGSKPILESTADVRKPAIVRGVRRRIIEPLIYLRKARVDRVSSRAGEKTAAAAEYVWRQVNIRPEVIQRESQDEVPRYHTCRRTARTRPPETVAAGDCHISARECNTRTLEPDTGIFPR